MGTKNILAGVLGCCFLLFWSISGCSSENQPAVDTAAEDHINVPFTKHGSLTMSRDGVVFREIAIEIADSDSSRTRGLMQRDKLPADSGMLFIFESETQQGFWMANTRLALDLVFIRTDGSVQSISKYVQPMSLDTVLSDGPAQYVLEVEAGYVDSVGLTEGDQIQWTALDASDAP
ncbi:DUF192 domain-containing protein [bacterium]|nr:DUF192 domain-containing protein [bacterium]